MGPPVSLVIIAILAISDDLPDKYEDIKLEQPCFDETITLSFPHQNYVLDKEKNATFLLTLYDFKTPFVFKASWLSITASITTGVVFSLLMTYFAAGVVYAALSNQLIHVLLCVLWLFHCAACHSRCHMEDSYEVRHGAEA